MLLSEGASNGLRITLGEAVKRLWAYVKKNGLQEGHQKSPRLLLERGEGGARRLLHLFVVIEHALEQLLQQRLQVHILVLRRPRRGAVSRLGRVGGVGGVGGMGGGIDAVDRGCR